VTASAPAFFDTSRRYRLHPKVALRPEPFGALAYHYGNRRLVFLRAPELVELVRDLGSHRSVDEALSGLPETRRPAFARALASLRSSDVITEEAPEDGAGAEPAVEAEP